MVLSRWRKPPDAPITSAINFYASVTTLLTRSFTLSMSGRRKGLMFARGSTPIYSGVNPSPLNRDIVSVPSVSSTAVTKYCYRQHNNEHKKIFFRHNRSVKKRLFTAKVVFFLHMSKNLTSLLYHPIDIEVLYINLFLHLAQRCLGATQTTMYLVFLPQNRK